MKNEIIEIENNQPELIYGVGLCEYIDLEKSINNLDSAVKNLAIKFMEVGKYLTALSRLLIDFSRSIYSNKPTPYISSG